MEIDLATDRLLTLKQAARMLGVCRRTVDNYVASGALPTTKPAGLRYTTQRAVSDFLHRNAAEPNLGGLQHDSTFEAILKKWSPPHEQKRETVTAPSPARA